MNVFRLAHPQEQVATPRPRSRIRRLWRVLRERNWRPELERLEPLRAVGRGRRAFLVGNGPSLATMDLSRLETEFVCVANLGLRAIGNCIPHADMHIVMDTHRYRRFAGEIERSAAFHAIPYRFLNLRMRHRWRRQGSGPRPHFLINSPRKLVAGEPVPDLSDGVVTGASVLLSGAMVLDFMNFEEIFLIGCDLEYAPAKPYFYAVGALDATHERDRKVIAKRGEMVDVNGEFAVLRAHFEQNGRRIQNAGVGGQLDSLQRVDFASLFQSQE